MTKHTKYQSYPYPEQNQRNWHQDLQLALTQIDADVQGIGDDSLTKDNVTANSAFTIPIYDSLTNYPSPADGDMAYATGSGVDSEGGYVYDGTTWIGPFAGGGGSDDTTAQDLTDLGDVEVGSRNERPASGTAGLYYLTTDQYGLYRDTGNGWDEIAVHPSQITQSKLPYDPLTGGELTNHTDTPDAHHTRYSDSEARSAVTGLVDAAELSGSSGVAGDVLVTDGQSASWSSTAGAGGSGAEIASGTITHTTGSYTEFYIENVTADETAMLTAHFAPLTEDQVNAIYSFNAEWSRRWDEPNTAVDVQGILVWDEDPGTDLDVQYSVRAV